MGYDLARFVSRIEVEFLCSICELVLEYPLQSSCEHMFCTVCINGWLVLETMCPNHDDKPITLETLKEPEPAICDLLNKLIIKCDFHRRGCLKVIPLKHLEDHERQCQFNPQKAVRKLIRIRDDNIEIPKWQEIFNLRTLRDGESNILQIDRHSIYAFAQSLDALTRTDSSFKIKVLTFDYFKYIAIGLTRRGHQNYKIPGLYEQSIGYDSAGDFMVCKKLKRIGMEWKIGDVIECGIEFPANFTCNQLVKIYFRRNDELVTSTKVALPENGYFPTVYVFEGVVGSWWNDGAMVCMLGSDTKFRYFKRNS